MTISAYSTTANSNTAINGLNIAEGCPPSHMNNMGREIMADLATQYSVAGTKFNVNGIPFAFDASGNVLIGFTTSSIYRFNARGDYGAAVRSTGGAAFEPLLVWNETASGDNLLVSFATEGTVTPRGSIDYNRAGNAVRYNTTSDERLKENIADAEPAGEIIDAIKVRSFDWKEGGAHTDYGFIAQELVELVPDAVRRGDNGETIADAWAVDFSKLVPLLVKEVQSLREGQQALLARVAALEAS